MPWPLYSQRKSPWYPLDRRLGRPQSWSGYGGEMNSHPIRTHTPNHPAHSPALQHYTIELSWLQTVLEEH